METFDQLLCSLCGGATSICAPAPLNCTIFYRHCTPPFSSSTHPPPPLPSHTVPPSTGTILGVEYTTNCTVLLEALLKISVMKKITFPVLLKMLAQKTVCLLGMVPPEVLSLLISSKSFLLVKIACPLLVTTLGNVTWASSCLSTMAFQHLVAQLL